MSTEWRLCARTRHRNAVMNKGGKSLFSWCWHSDQREDNFKNQNITVHSISSGDKCKLNYKQQARKCREMRTIGVGSSERQASAQRFGERKEGATRTPGGRAFTKREAGTKALRQECSPEVEHKKARCDWSYPARVREMGDLESPAEAPGWFVFHCAFSWCCLVFVCLGHTQWNMWDLSSPIRHQTQVPCMDTWRPNHWTTREGSRVSYRCNRKPWDGDSKSSQT